jgi:predicted metal-dependent phosphoesterase TrpH
MTGHADLHTTHFSDGLHAPGEIVAPRRHGPRPPLTDHDGVDALPAAKAAGERASLEVIAGVELSVDIDGRDVHILGYFIDPRDPRLREHLQRYREARTHRAREIVRRLNAHNMELTWQAVLAQAGRRRSAGRTSPPRSSRRGYVDTYEDAFEIPRNDKPCYGKKVSIPPDRRSTSST